MNIEFTFSDFMDVRKDEELTKRIENRELYNRIKNKVDNKIAYIADYYRTHDVFLPKHIMLIKEYLQAN